MDLDNLLARIFNDEASNEEKAQLELWKQEGVDNLNALQDMSVIWEDSNGLKDYQEFDENRAWQKLNSAIVSEELKTPVQKNNTYSIVRRLMPLAASLLLLVAVGIGIKSYLGGDTLSEPTSFAANAMEKQDVLLSDNSKILLDRNSTLEVLSDFTDERLVSLSGRAYYEVESDVENPFTINTNHGDVTVVGTEFTLSTTPEKTELFLYEGRVNYTHKGKVIELKPSEAILVENGEILKYRFNKQNGKSWITDKLVFEGATISEVFKTLETHYGIKISSNSKLIDTSCTFSSVYTGASLKDILEEMSAFFSFDYVERDGQIMIKKLSC